MKRASQGLMRTLLLTLVASLAVACSDSDGTTSNDGGGSSTGTGAGSGGFDPPVVEGTTEGHSSGSDAATQGDNAVACTNPADIPIDVSLPFGFEPALAAGQYVDSMLGQGFLPDSSALRFEPLRAYLENRDGGERLEAWVEPRGTDSVRLQVRTRAAAMGTLSAPPDHVVVVLDVSSSMAQSATLRDQELEALVSHLAQRPIPGRFSLITFAGEAVRVLEGVDAANAPSELASASTQLVPGDGHNLSAALKEAAALVDSKERTQLIVLTDGGFSADSSALEQARALRDGGALLSAVQLTAPTGFQRSELAGAQTALHLDMLTELAKAGGGFALFSDGTSFDQAVDSWLPSVTTRSPLGLVLPGDLPTLDLFSGEVANERQLPSTVTGTASVALYTGCLHGDGPFALTIDGKSFDLKRIGGQWALQDSVRTKADQKLQAVVQALRSQTPPNEEMLPGDFVCEALAAFSSPVACGTSGLDPSCGYAAQVDAFYETVCSEFCGSCGAF